MPVMYHPPAPPTEHSTAILRLFVGVLILMSALLVLLGLGVASYFRLGSDTRALRNGVLAASGARWQQRIALNVGGLTLGLARAGLSFAPLDEPARAALRSVRGGEVGIFELSAGAAPPDRAAMLAAADAALGARGWERVVGVMAERKLVAVYVPGENVTAQSLNCCVLVLDDRQMVLALARTNPQPLVQCLLNQSTAPARLHRLANAQQERRSDGETQRGEAARERESRNPSRLN